MKQFFSRSVRILIIISLIATLLAIVAFISVLVMRVAHLPVPIPTQKALFVIGTVLFTLAETLEYIFVVPAIFKTKSIWQRLMLVLALIPFVNLMLALNILFYTWIRARLIRSRTRDEPSEERKNELKAAYQYNSDQGKAPYTGVPIHT